MKRVLFFLIFTLSLIANSDDPAQKIDTPPNPAELKASWWSYYEVDQERLIVRIQKTTAKLQALAGELSPSQRELALPLIDQIPQGLQTYRTLLTKKIPKPTIEPHFHQQYSYQEFLELIDRLSEKELLQESKNQQIKIEKGNLKTDQSQLDTQTADYLSTSKSDPIRIIKGMKIMNRKIATEIDQLKVNELQVYAEIGKQEIQALRDEIGHARNLINASQINLSALKQEIEARKRALYQAQEAQVKTQSAMAQDRGLLASQEVLYFTLIRAHAELYLINAELKSLLGQILTEKERATVKELYFKLNDLKERENTILQELDDWKSAADLYSELALFNGNQETITLSQNTGSLIQKIDRVQRKNSYLFTQAEVFIRTHYTTFKDRIRELWENLLAKAKLYSKWSHKSMFKIGQTPITLYGLFKVILIILITYFLAKFVQIWIRRIGKKQSRIQRAGIYTLSRISYYVIFIIGLLVAIGGTGIDFTTFAVIAGALSVGIGFGLQSIVNNFISGIILLLEKKLRVGDLVELESKEIGRVLEINVRTTLVRTFDNVEILVPNSDLVSKKFINWTLSDKVRRIRVPFGVAFGTDKEKLKQVVTEAAQNIPITVIDRPPQVWLSKIGESSLDFELVVWVNETLVDSPPMGTQAWYTWEVESALRAHNISIPFPVRDVHLTKEF